MRTHGGRVPVPWLIGTGGIDDVHSPAVRHVRFHRHGGAIYDPGDAAGLPLDVFIVGARELRGVMREYPRSRGYPGNAAAVGIRLSAISIARWRSREEILRVA